MQDHRSILKDIRHGKNIGTHILILVSIILSVLNIFGVLQPYVAPITLGILALLLSGRLADREQFENFETKISSLQQSDKALIEGGIQSSWKEQPSEKLNEQMRKATKNIRILGTWIPGMNPLPLGVIDAAKRGVVTQILLLKPKSEITAQRTIDLRWDKEKPIEAYKDLRRQLKQSGLLESPTVQVRFYEALPPFRIYMADEFMLMSYYWHPDGSSTGPHLEIFNNGSCYFGEYILKTFDNLWESPTTSTMESLDDGYQAIS